MPIFIKVTGGCEGDDFTSINVKVVGRQQHALKHLFTIEVSKGVDCITGQILAESLKPPTGKPFSVLEWSVKEVESHGWSACIGKRGAEGAEYLYRLPRT